ncbi:MAG: Xre family transcriptional regulator [Firmicutes bacterium]|nr:Xre family transcriptional regulator [Bacillota bacterium]
MKKGNMIFAERIKAFREEKGVSQEELASKYGYTKQTVSSWENNGQIPRDTVLRSLANFFNTSTDYLLGLTDDSTLTTAPAEPKKPKDLLKLIEQEDYTLNGRLATPEDKKRLQAIIINDELSSNASDPGISKLLHDNSIKKMKDVTDQIPEDILKELGVDVAYREVLTNAKEARITPEELAALVDAVSKIKKQGD